MRYTWLQAASFPFRQPYSFACKMSESSTASSELLVAMAAFSYRTLPHSCTALETAGYGTAPPTWLVQTAMSSLNPLQKLMWYVCQWSRLQYSWLLPYMEVMYIICMIFSFSLSLFSPFVIPCSHICPTGPICAGGGSGTWLHVLRHWGLLVVGDSLTLDHNMALETRGSSCLRDT